MKHGFLALKSIARDPSLPFHRTHLERHIRNVFLYGSTDSLPAALDELTDTDMAGAYVLYRFILSPYTLQLASRITSYNFSFCIALEHIGAFTLLCSTLFCEYSPLRLFILFILLPTEKFVQLSLRTFAEPKELELRMSQILECVTAELPEG